MNKTSAPDSQAFPSLLRGRVHDVSGGAAPGFAAIVCSLHQGTIIWIDDTHHNEKILPAGLAQFYDPARVVFAHGHNTHDTLWIAEECLRSKAASVVVARLSKPLSFTNGRRLQLAAEAGNSLGLFIMPEGMGSNSAETRWQCEPYFSPDDSTLLHWKLTKNKSGTLGNWITRWDEQTHRIIVVPETGKRSDFARATD